METLNHSAPTVETGKQASLAELLKTLEQNCRNCKPLTPITCVTDCKTWKLKNQLRKIHGKMHKPNYMEQLLNTLKNNRRLQLLGMISKQRYGTYQLQQELKSLGYTHSQQTIVEEYIHPLVEVGLVQETENPYQATVFGCRVNELVKNFSDLENTLSPHSECHEETVLDALIKGPKTYKVLKTLIAAKSVARVLSRLQRASLVETSKEKNYIFFFRTKRDANLSTYSPTEERVYHNIPAEGISAKKLSEKSGISLRRSYKYLRKLKGKKMVFVRRKPLAYSLTVKGSKVAEMLEALRNLTVETQATVEQLLRNKEAGPSIVPQVHSQKKRDEEILTLAKTA